MVGIIRVDRASHVKGYKIRKSVLPVERYLRWEGGWTDVEIADHEGTTRCAVRSWRCRNGLKAHRDPETSARLYMWANWDLPMILEVTGLKKPGWQDWCSRIMKLGSIQLISTYDTEVEMRLSERLFMWANWDLPMILEVTGISYAGWYHYVKHRIGGYHE